MARCSNSPLGCRSEVSVPSLLETPFSRLSGDLFVCEKVSGTIVRRFLVRAAPGTEGRLQIESLRHAIHPRLAPVGLPAVRAATHCIQLALALGTIDTPQPVLRHADRPRAQRSAAFRIAESAPPNARPSPLLRAVAQAGTQRVPLHVPADRPQMLVRLHQKRLESSLIHVPRSHRAAMGVPALRMRQRKPADERRKVARPPAARPPDASGSASHNTPTNASSPAARPRPGSARTHHSLSRCQRSAFGRSPDSARDRPTRPKPSAKVVPCRDSTEIPLQLSTTVPDTFSSPKFWPCVPGAIPLAGSVPSPHFPVRPVAPCSCQSRMHSVTIRDFVIPPPLAGRCNERIS